jgi:penicillin-insensitive murein endopeptidase
MKTPLALSLFLLLLSPVALAEGLGAELIGTDELTAESIPPLPGSDLFQGSVEQAEKFYSGGSLMNPSVMPDAGFGFVKLYLPRHRAFSSYDMTELLKDAAGRLQQLHPSRDRLMIGDMSGEHGGFISGHASHQNGLDTDVAYLRADQTEQDPNYTKGFEQSFVKKGRLTANFDLPRNWDILKILVSSGRVQRIFVNSVVKKAFCAYAKAINELESQKETLKRLRVIAGHTDHFHVRITCPRNSPACRPQEDMPDDTGC